MGSSPKKILLAASGSIAAYKAADIVSALVKQGHEVRCLLTRNATRFVTPTVMETLSRNPVLTDLFEAGVSGTEHIRLARWADLMVFAPCTANVIAKLALGLADDLVSTVALATESPWLIAPAMNTVMWNQKITQSHVSTLRARGVQFIEPDSGILACGENGAGKLASPERIVADILKMLESTNQDLKGQRILITAGPTTSAIDAVRYLTNPSTGKMGAALAEEAISRGAEVDYILGIDKGVVRPCPPSSSESRFHLVEVRTAEQMCEAALAVQSQASGIIATAAVLDYRVEHSSAEKLKRTDEPVTLTLVPSIDVLATLRSRARPGQWFLGFAAETQNHEKHARDKLAQKGLDYLFLNPIAKQGQTLNTGFGVSTNGGTLFRRNGTFIEIPPQEKRLLACAIWNAIAADLTKKGD